MGVMGTDAKSEMRVIVVVATAAVAGDVLMSRRILVKIFKLKGNLPNFLPGFCDTLYWNLQCIESKYL